MNKKELVAKTAEVLRQNNIRKPISMPKQVFHISDDEGNQKDFTVRKTDKTYLYNAKDITAVLDACLDVIKDATRRGEDVTLHGFGTFGVHKREARKARHPVTKELVDVAERYVPKFSFGNDMRKAAKLYELSLSEQETIYPSYIGEEGNSDD